MKKSEYTRRLQRFVWAFRKIGDRRQARIFMEAAVRSRQQRDEPEPTYNDMEGVWWDRRSTRYVNG